MNLITKLFVHSLVAFLGRYSCNIANSADSSLDEQSIALKCTSFLSSSIASEGSVVLFNKTRAILMMQIAPTA
jgi:hypothetical protein